ncbi:MAG: hypothetical protein OEN50_19335 [Deltaproteobacteria bacterium]|nr:hypothetical protein [Deltaproteobacteria bacterium]
MDAVLAMKSLSYGLVLLLAATLLALSLLSLRKEVQTGRSLIGFFPVALIITALCAVIALYTAYMRIHRARVTELHLDRTNFTIDGSAADHIRDANRGQHQ